MYLPTVPIGSEGGKNDSLLSAHYKTLAQRLAGRIAESMNTCLMLHWSLEKLRDIENSPSLDSNQITNLQNNVNINNASILDLQTKNNKNTSDIITNIASM